MSKSLLPSKSPQFDLRALVNTLLGAGYLLERKGKFLFTADFYEAFSGTRQGVTATGTGELAVVEPLLPLAAPKKERNWTEEYTQFIMASMVPARLTDNMGRPYAANKYSEAGMKAYRKAVEKEGVDPELLSKSTILYYKSSIAYKKAIGNYMSDGDWRTDYRALQEAVEERGIEGVQERINEETKIGYNGGVEWG